MHVASAVMVAIPWAIAVIAVIAVITVIVGFVVAAAAGVVLVLGWRLQ